MELKICILIGTWLLLLTSQPSSSLQACTSFADLADPCGCTLSKDNFDPLCGTDGNTYLNSCFLHCRETIDSVTIRVDHKGICTKDGRCTCNAEYKPVCGSNGVTYSNDCVLKCHAKKDSSLRLRHNGACDDSDKSRLRSKIRTCVCNPSTGPLCATNGVSYPNYCVMRCKAEALNDKSIKFAYWGLCQSQEIGTDNKSDENEDQIVVEGGEGGEQKDEGNKEKEYLDDGPPIIQLEPGLSGPESKKRICDCPLNSVSYFARCGNYGRSHTSLRCFCMPNNQQLKHQDPCKVRRPSRPEGDDEKLNMVVSKTCVCAALHKPVCGTNHQTYANMCVLHCRAKKNPSIKFQQWGNCGDIRLVSRLKDLQNDGEETLYLE